MYHITSKNDNIFLNIKHLEDMVCSSDIYVEILNGGSTLSLAKGKEVSTDIYSSYEIVKIIRKLNFRDRVILPNDNSTGIIINGLTVLGNKPPDWCNGYLDAEDIQNAALYPEGTLRDHFYPFFKDADTGLLTLGFRQNDCLSFVFNCSPCKTSNCYIVTCRVDKMI